MGTEPHGTKGSLQIRRAGALAQKAFMNLLQPSDMMGFSLGYSLMASVILPGSLFSDTIKSQDFPLYRRCPCVLLTTNPLIKLFTVFP